MLEQRARVHLLFSTALGSLHCCGLMVLLRGRVLRPEDAWQKRFSWFFYRIQKVQKRLNLVDLVKSFQTSIYLQTSASIQPKTDLSKFAKYY